MKSPTIVAPATAIGGGSIAVVRLSGSDSIHIVNTVFKGKDLTALDGYSGAFGELIDEKNERIDDVVVFVYRAPHSYTGENAVEISCHGSLVAVEKIISRLLTAGANMAEPGEFTKRAFLNDKMDLIQAEAVADVVSSSSELIYRNASLQLRGVLSRKIVVITDTLKEVAGLLELELDFSEEDISFSSPKAIVGKIEETRSILQVLNQSFSYSKIMLEGIHLAIVGRPNTGKSSLLNAFLKRERAIVSHIPGTTRDSIEENIHFGRLLVRVIDTAGLRKSADLIEQEGVRRTRAIIDEADFVLFIFDGSEPLNAEDLLILEKDLTGSPPERAAVIYNKIDRKTNKETLQKLQALEAPLFEISAKTGHGVNPVAFHVEHQFLQDLNFQKEEVAITNLRHKKAIDNALGHLKAAINGINNGIGNELIADDIRHAINTLYLILGKITSEDVLNTIFSRFCIGK